MVRNILLYNHQHADFPMQSDQLEAYVPKSLVYSILWSFTGDSKMRVCLFLGASLFYKSDFHETLALER